MNVGVAGRRLRRASDESFCHPHQSQGPASVVSLKFTKEIKAWSTVPFLSFPRVCFV
jgi:hypothetical protein